MAIKITEEPDVYMTAEERDYWMYQYHQAFMYHTGPKPSFEAWVRRQLNGRKERR